MTSRKRFYKDAVSVTLKWAQNHLYRSGFAPEIIFNEHKLDEVERRGMIFAFEDHPPTVLELLSKDICVFMHSMPFNRMGRKDSEKLEEEELKEKKSLMKEIYSHENQRLFAFNDYSTVYASIRNIFQESS
jgi:hypothetical protein